MDKDALVIFDFDGTLYPIDPYDSEQALLLALAQGSNLWFRLRAHRLVRQDQKGQLAGRAFHQRYAELTRHADKRLVEHIGRNLAKHLGSKERDSILQLAEHADLGILSCGTENIIEAFLQEAGLLGHFSFIRAKRLSWDAEGTAHMHVDIDRPEAKAEAITVLRSTYRSILAVGDGPTDIPMLKAADLGLVMNWSTRQASYPFATYTSLKELCSHCLSHLDNASEACRTAKR
ncbi:MAG: HAD family hydrolase [Spirochaetia bacterium]|nr:HAD family hydrolase [Spirochaetia bacterium]